MLLFMCLTYCYCKINKENIQKHQNLPGNHHEQRCTPSLQPWHNYSYFQILDNLKTKNLKIEIFFFPLFLKILSQEFNCIIFLPSFYFFRALFKIGSKKSLLILHLRLIDHYNGFKVKVLKQKKKLHFY